ncbi:MAG: WG repeat-containing protein [Tenericutes bacterium]|nr:WG repeat-containing protein [Mycoplasmatota bacterium]
MKKILLTAVTLLMLFGALGCAGTEGEEHFSHDWFMALNQENMYGYLDDSGEEMLPFIYEWASYFNNGYAVVTVDGLDGVIDHEGNYQIESKYTSIRPICDSKYFVVSEDDDRSQNILLDISGNVLVNIVDGIYIDDTNIDGIFIFRKDGKIGIVNIDNIVVVEPIYDRMFKSQDGVFRVEKDDLYGYIDETGEVIVELVYDMVSDFHNGYGSVCNDNDVCRVVDTNGDFLFSETSATGFKFNREGVSIIAEKVDIHHYKYGLITTEGDIIQNIIYTKAEVEYSLDGIEYYLFYDENDVAYVVDLLGNILFQTDEFIVSKIYDDIILLDDLGERVKRNLGKYVIDYDGNVIAGSADSQVFISFDLEDELLLYVAPINSQLDTAEFDIYDSDGTLLIESIVTGGIIFNYEHECIYISNQLENDYRIINFKGETIITFNSIGTGIYQDYITTEVDGLYGVYDYKGNIVIPFEYLSVRSANMYFYGDY